MRILMMAAEMVPFARTGQIADVVGALASALAESGHDVRVAMPRYDHIDTERFGLEPIGPAFPVPVDDHVEYVTGYRTQLGSGVTVYMVHSPKYLNQRVTSMYTDDADPFVLYCRATMEMLKHVVPAWQPQIVHCHDWQTSIVPNWLATLYRDDPFYASTASVLTIHRLSHQGIFGYRVLEEAGIKEYGFIYHAGLSDLNELVDLLGRGIYYSDAVTTVSEHYAQDIQTPEFGERLDPLLREKGPRLYGIRNGIDTKMYDPSTDTHIAAPFDAATLENRARNKTALQRLFALDEDRDSPLIAMVSRLNDAKGLDLVTQVIPPMMAHLNAQVVVLGVGEPKYHDLLTQQAAEHPGRVSIELTFSEAVERRIYAGSDIFLMPSRVEPCGLGHMLAMRYGCVPVVRHTGGLADTVQDYDPRLRRGNGFAFSAYDAMALYAAIVRATQMYAHHDIWRLLQERCMACDFSWLRPASRYMEVYRQALETQCTSASQGHLASSQEPPGLVS